MALTEAALLRARGVEVTLGGQTRRLRYDFDAMEKIETQYEGLDDFIDGLMTWKRRFRTLRFALEVGLAGDGVTPGEVAAGLNQTTGGDLLDMMRAVAMALSEAMGVEVVIDPKDEGDTDSPDLSPGEPSTDSLRSPLDAQTPSSGE
jgi:hypothetical protein